MTPRETKEAATIVIDNEGNKAPLSPVLATAASAVPERQTTTSLTPDQVNTRDRLIDNMRQTVVRLQQVRRAEAKEIHAVIVQNGADLMRLIADVDGPNEAFTRLREVWNPFLDVKTSPETQRYQTTLYKGRTERVEATVNRQYRQYFTIWDLLIAVQAGLYKKGWNQPTGTFRLHGKDYQGPVDMLNDQNTVTDVFQCVANIVRPAVIDLDELPGPRAAKELFFEGLTAVQRLGVTVRLPVKFKESGKDKTRMQRKKLNVVPARGTRSMPLAAWAGLLAGILSEAHRQGVIGQEITLPESDQKMTILDFVKGQIDRPTFALPETEKDEDEGDEEVEEDNGEAIDTRAAAAPAQITK